MRFFGRRFSDADLRHDANIFTLLRWLLASSVIFSHSFVLTGTGVDPSRALLPFPISRLAVLLFFSLSGFLVTGSLLKRGPREFAIARALRLLPGLWAMLFVTAALIALWFTGATKTPDFWLYVTRNAILLSNAFTIPHVFDANPLPNTVNGSLWTLRHEFRCYVGLAVVGALGLLSRRKLLLTLFVVAVGVHIVIPPDAVRAVSGRRESRGIPTGAVF
jgi:peptidoglycan/LPS O-acetylase OafA/YrhL